MSTLLQVQTRKTLPLDFTLRNEQSLAALYILDTPGGQTLTLELTNCAGESLDLLTPAAAQPYHFELVFRPGVLNLDALPHLTLQEGPHATLAPPVTNPDGTVALRLTVPAQTLATGEKLTFTLQHVEPDGRLGSRGTRVLLRYANVQVHGAGVVIGGFRETHLNLVSHLGKPTIPLHLGVVGAGTVLNNGSNNSNDSSDRSDLKHPLTIRVSNVSSTATIQPGDKATFYLSFDTGEKAEEWALGTADQVRSISVTYHSSHNQEEAAQTGSGAPAGPWWSVVDPLKATKTGSNTWQGAVQQGSDVTKGVYWAIPVPVLKPGEYLDIRLDNVVTKHPAGLTNVYLRYENVPGYWDGQLTTQLEKSPLVFRDGKVGIGKAPDDGMLSVAGQGEDAHAVLAVSSDAPVGTWLKLRNKSTGGREWCLISTGTENGEGAGNLLVYDGTTRAVFDGQGHVGLGTTRPAQKLQLGDAADTTPTFLAVQAADGVAAGVQLRHGDENTGYDLTSDGQSLSIVSNKREAARVRFSGQKHAMEVVIEADTDDQEGDTSVLTFTTQGGRVNGQVGFLGAASKSFAMVNNASRTSLELNQNGNVNLRSGDTFLTVKGDGTVGVYRDGYPNAIWASYTRISDIRLKTDIEPIARPLQRLCSLRGISFRWKNPAIGQERELGVVAQEVEQVFPELMHHLDGQDAKMVQYEKFVPVLIEALKEQQQQIEELRAALGRLTPGALT